MARVDTYANESANDDELIAPHVLIKPVTEVAALSGTLLSAKFVLACQ
jgi:hypothetical protein